MLHNKILERKINNKMEHIYAALLLHKLGKEINEENLKKVIIAAGAESDESKIKSLIASLKGIDIEKELENATVAAPQASRTSGSAEPEKKEEKEEEKHEAAAEGLSALFG